MVPYYEIDKTSPVAEVVEKLPGEAASGIVYVPTFLMKIALASGAAAAFAVAQQNPFGIDLIIKRAISTSRPRAEPQAPWGTWTSSRCREPVPGVHTRGVIPQERKRGP